jgi:hypothetical protein
MNYLQLPKYLEAVYSIYKARECVMHGDKEAT